jgi:hypothetical protein
MKQTTKHLKVLIHAILYTALVVAFLLTGFATMAQNTAANNNQKNNNGAAVTMKTYVIERDIPGAGQFTPAKLKDISKTSCTVLKEMGPEIEWIHSYVTDNKIFCIYKAENIELVKEHAKRGGFPANAIYEVSNVIGPETAKN